MAMSLANVSNSVVILCSRSRGDHDFPPTALISSTSFSYSPDCTSMSDLQFFSPAIIMSVQTDPFMSTAEDDRENGVRLSGNFSVCSSENLVKTDNTMFFQYGNVCDCILVGHGAAFQLE